MPTYRTKGIVIKYSDLREADRIFTFYTANMGKVRAVAKGVRKTLSKLGCHLDLFSLVQLELAEGRNLDTVIGAHATDCFTDIRKSLNKTSQMYYLVELIDKLVPDAHKDTRIFDLLSSVLKILDSDICTQEKEENLVAQAFKVKMLQLVGLFPQLGKCSRCGEQVAAENNYHFINQLGGVKCHHCRNVAGVGTKLPANSLKLLRTMMQKDIIFISKIDIDDRALAVSDEVLDNYIKYVIDREPRSLRFITKVKGLASGV